MPLSYYHQSIRKIVLLPVIVAPVLTPKPSIDSNPDFFFSDNESEILRKQVIAQANKLNDTIFISLQSGRFHFQIIQAIISELEILKNSEMNQRKSIFSTHSNLGKIYFSLYKIDTDFHYDHLYFLKKEYVIQLIQKYNADAIFFHIVEPRTVHNEEFYYLYNTGGHTNTGRHYIPSQNISYKPILYGKDGNILFNIEHNSTPLYFLHFPVKIKHPEIEFPGIRIGWFGDTFNDRKPAKIKLDKNIFEDYRIDWNLFRIPSILDDFCDNNCSLKVYRQIKKMELLN